MGKPMAEQVGPFIRELATVKRMLAWHIDTRGRIRGRHVEYFQTFSPIEAVAWAASGMRFDTDYEAGRYLKIEKVASEIKTASDRRSASDATRKAILEAVGLK